jgi:hypothetical protein
VWGGEEDGREGAEGRSGAEEQRRGSGGAAEGKQRSSRGEAGEQRRGRQGAWRGPWSGGGRDVDGVEWVDSSAGREERRRAWCGRSRAEGNG